MPRGPGSGCRWRARCVSGLALPGLSVVPLTRPGWWHRPMAEWLVRQVCKYAWRGEGDADRDGMRELEGFAVAQKTGYNPPSTTAGDGSQIGDDHT
jgi:hypothetical protein